MFFKTYFRSLRNHTLAYTLNILRLVLAFAPFIIIATQLKYDLTFDRHQKDYKQLYRAERTFQSEHGIVATAWINFPLGEDIIASSPYVEAGAVICPFLEQTYATVENRTGMSGYMVHFIPTTPDIVKVLDFEMLEGTAESIYAPGTVLIPKSLAERMFPGESSIDQVIKSPDAIYMCTYKDLIVKGVYKDFPENSQFGDNGIFIQMDSHNNVRTSRRYSNFNIYLKLTSPDVADAVVRNYKDKYSQDNENLDEIRLTRICDLYYKSDMENDPYTVHGQLSTTITLAGIIILILLIAGTNFTNFSLAMIPFRIKSVNTRKVIGCPVTRLRLEMIADAVISMLLALLLSIGIVYLIHGSSLSQVIIADFNPSNNLPILGIVIIIAIFIGAIAELYPSRYITSFPPALVLKGSFGLSGHGRFLRRALLVGQFIISIVLIDMALIIHKQNSFMRNTDIGINKDRIALMTIGTATNEKRDALLDRIRQLPEVVEVAYADEKIGAVESYQNWGVDMGNNTYMQTIMIPVSWNMLDLLDIPIYEGRDFTKSDGQENPAFIVTKTTQENENIELGIHPNNYDFVGVCGDVHVMSLRKGLANTTFLYKESMLGPSGVAYVKIQDGVDLLKIVQKLRDTYAEYDPYFPVEIEFFDSAIDNLYRKELVFEKSINWCSTLAILISMLGIFGLIFFDTQQRRKEMAVRRIMGAENRDILWNINRPYMILLAICYVVSVPIIVYLSKVWMSNFQYQAEIGPGIYVLSLVIILVITLLTINFQAFRSIRHNPVESIKIE